VYPSHESGVRVSGCVWQDIGQKSGVDIVQVRGRARYRVVEMGSHLSGDRLPYGTLTNVFEIVESVVEDSMSLSAERRPMGGI
jgi:hypothetical protein